MHARYALLFMALLAARPLAAQDVAPVPAIDWTPVPLAAEFAATSGPYAQPQCQSQRWLSLPLAGLPGGRLWWGESRQDACLPYRAYEPEAIDHLRLPPRPEPFREGASR